MSDKPKSLYDAVAAFLGPLSADYARIIDEGHDDTPVTVSLGGYDHETTLAVIKQLDRAYAAAFEDRCNRSAKRAERKAKGGLL